MEKAVKRFPVAFHYFSVTGRQALSEIEAKHASHRLCAKKDSAFFGGCGKAFSKLPGSGGKFFVESRHLYQSQRRKSRRHCDRVAGKRTGLVHGPTGARHCMMSRLPPNAAIGIPPPITLPSVVMSGLTL